MNDCQKFWLYHHAAQGMMGADGIDNGRREIPTLRKHAPGIGVRESENVHFGVGDGKLRPGAELQDGLEFVRKCARLKDHAKIVKESCDIGVLGIISDTARNAPA
jgi:hypothetical protein